MDRAGAIEDQKRAVGKTSAAVTLVILCATVGVAALASCTDPTGSADHVASLEFTALPYPAVVAGDTLRDSLGVAAPLRAHAYNGSGAEVANADVEFIALDTGLTITGTRYVIARRRSGSVPILASSPALQTKALPLIITRSPDSIAFTGATRDTITYDLLSPSTAVSKDLAIKVITRDTAAGITATQGWVVSYQVTFRHTVVAAGDTSVVFLRDEAARRSNIDTTNSAGTAARRLRLNLVGLSPPAVDSAIVTTTVRHRGSQIRGSPLRFVILLRPK